MENAITITNSKKNLNVACDGCKDMFSSYKSYLSHLNPKNGENYMCCICNKDYKNLSLLKIHLNLQHPSENLCGPCKLCKKKFQSVKHLVNHSCRNMDINERNEMYLYNCNKCNKKSFSNYDDYERHQIKHQLKFYKCDFCDKQFLSYYVFKAHRSVHLRFEPYECDTCFIGFETQEELQLHIESKHALKINVESGAPLYTTHKLDGDLNSIISLPKKMFYCHVCDYSCGDRNKLTIHGATKHKVNINLEKFECNCCQITFNLVDDLKSHLDLKHSIYFEDCKGDVFSTPILCHICKEVFYTKSFLQEHYKTHSCKAFVSKNTTKKVLSDGNNYGKTRCHVCNVNFGSRAEVEKHKCTAVQI